MAEFSNMLSLFKEIHWSHDENSGLSTMLSAFSRSLEEDLAEPELSNKYNFSNMHRKCYWQ